MNANVKLTHGILISMMIVEVFIIIGMGYAASLEEEFMGPKDVRYEKAGKPTFGSDRKPNPYWAQFPTGRFTHDELFSICAITAMVEYLALNSRIENQEPEEDLRSRIHLVIRAGQTKLTELKQRDVLLHSNLLQYQEEVSARFYTEAYEGGQQSLVSILKRDGYKQFYGRLISGCYRNLSRW